MVLRISRGVCVDDLSGMSSALDSDLYEAEKKLLEAVIRGKRAQLGGETIRGSFVRDLALELRDDWPIQPSGIHINDAVIDGEVNLEGCSVQKPLLFFRCKFGKAEERVPTLQLRDARIKRFGLYQCVLYGRFNADRAKFDGAAFIQGTVIHGRLRLRGAQIDGSLSLEETSIIEDEVGVVLDHASLQGPLLLRGAHIRGELRMPGARINGGVLAETVNIENEGSAIIADSVQIDGPWVMSDARISGTTQLRGSELKGMVLHKSHFSAESVAFQAEGIRVEGDWVMPHAKFEGALVLTNGRIHGRLHADNCEVRAKRHAFTGGGLYVRQGLNMDHARFVGSVRLDGAEIGKTFKANHVSITVHGQALTANVIHIGGDWIMRDARIKGSVRIPGADIGGQLALTSSHIEGAPLAIRADGARIMGGWFMGRATIKGKVRLPASYIGNQLRFRGSSFTVHGGPAIILNGSTVKRDVMFDGGFTSNGGISIDQTEVGGDVDLSDSKIRSGLISRGGKPLGTWDEDDLVEQYDRVALSFVDAKVSRVLMPKDAENRPEGIVDLSRAYVGTYVDFASGWPPALTHWSRKNKQRICDEAGADIDHLILDGFNYEHLENPSGKQDDSISRASEMRTNWLAGQTGADLFHNFKPQAWVHLGKRLSAQGFHEDARQISIARRRWHRRSSSVRRRSQVQSWLLDVFALFGFNPWRTVGWMACFVLLFAGIWFAASQGCRVSGCGDETVFVRTEYGRFSADPDRFSRTYPEFHPLAYSFDLFIPVISFGYQDYWRPNLKYGPIAEVPVPIIDGWSGEKSVKVTWGGILYVLYILEMILGLVLTSLTVTGFTGMLRYDE